MKVCIIGGGAGGRSASGRIRQLDKQSQIDLFTTQSEIGYAPCELPFGLRGATNWDDIFYPGNFFKEMNVTVHFNSRVTDILRDEKCIMAEGQSYPYDKLVLSPGAVPSIPPIPGVNDENVFTLSTNIADYKAFDKIIPQYNTAAVIGAGAIGIENAMALMARGYQRVYLLDMLENILPASLDKDMAEKVEKVMKQKGLELIMSAKVSGIRSDSGKKYVILPDRELEVDIVVLTTGARPDIELAQKAGLKIGETGGISVNEYLQTSDPDIYAAGDCIENWDRIIGSKARHLMVTTAGTTGNIAATNLVSGNSITYEGTMLTFVIDIFGNQIGTTGFTERVAQEKGLDIVTTTTSNPSTRPRYGGKIFHCKLIADRKTQMLVGVQIISEEKIRGVVNGMTLAIAEKIPLQRLALLESPYSPPLGGDPIQGAVRILLNQLS